MKASSDRILTSHAGSLPRPDALIEANRTRAAAHGSDEAEFQAQLSVAVKEVGVSIGVVVLAVLETAEVVAVSYAWIR